MVTKDEASFIIRLWLEPSLEGLPRWRGHIRHIQGDEETYFPDLNGAVGFIARFSDVPLSRDPTGIKRAEAREEV